MGRIKGLLKVLALVSSALLMALFVSQESGVLDGGAEPTASDPAPMSAPAIATSTSDEGRTLPVEPQAIEVPQATPRAAPPTAQADLQRERMMMAGSKSMVVRMHVKDVFGAEIRETNEDGLLTVRATPGAILEAVGTVETVKTLDDPFKIEGKRGKGAK